MSESDSRRRTCGRNSTGSSASSDQAPPLLRSDDRLGDRWGGYRPGGDAQGPESLSGTEAIGNPEAWVFRIAHNAALDLLRRRARQQPHQSDESMDMIVDPANPIEDRQAVTVSLRTFMHLPVAQRGAVILKDVLGYSLEEIGHVMQATFPAVKATLHRGRQHLRDLADAPEERSAPSWRSRNARASPPMSTASMPMILTRCERCLRTKSRS